MVCVMSWSGSARVSWAARPAARASAAVVSAGVGARGAKGSVIIGFPHIAWICPDGSESVDVPTIWLMTLVGQKKTRLGLWPGGKGVTEETNNEGPYYRSTTEFSQVRFSIGRTSGVSRMVRRYFKSSSRLR